VSLELNKIHLGNNIELIKQLEDSSVDLIITSPPYNKGYWSDNQDLRTNNGVNFYTKSRRIRYGDFDDCLEPLVYEQQQRELIKECLRVLKPTGSFFYNHIDILHHHQTIHPKYVYDFPLKQTIIWNRLNTPRLDKSYFFPITEYIFWFQKATNSRVKFDRSQCGFQKNVWEISPDGSNKHPAPFPLAIVENIILATTNIGDIVLDPYMGSGTTALGASNLDRQFIGFEFVQDFIDMANKRLENKSVNLFQ
jgi:modification methylase